LQNEPHIAGHHRAIGVVTNTCARLIESFVRSVSGDTEHAPAVSIMPSRYEALRDSGLGRLETRLRKRNLSRNIGWWPAFTERCIHRIVS
jgi:hypothetical protein